MASPPPNPRAGDDGGGRGADDDSPPAAPKTVLAPPPAPSPPLAPHGTHGTHAPQAPHGTKLHYVALAAPGPSGIKQCFRTVKAARRVPTLPRRREDPAAPAPPPEPRERRARRDRSKRHVCGTCDKRFSSPGKLSQHVLSHTGELPFSCDLCDKRFNSKFKLVRHNLIHSEARAFACNVCGKTFNRKDHLTNHVRVHNPVKKLYTCERPDCRKSYTSLLSYRKHAALHSAEEGNLQCKICDEVFTTTQDIVYHLKVHTGSRTVKNETDKKFTCTYCERRFFTAKDVRRHQVVHTGRRDFLCPHCPQKFGRKDHLVRHVKNAHPEESWRSAAVGTSKDPTPEASSFDEIVIPEPASYTEYAIESPDYAWKSPSPKDPTPEGPTRVPSSDIIVEIPPDFDIKMEPVEIKIERPTSPSCELLPMDFPVVFMVPPTFQAAPDLPYLTEPLPELLPSSLMLDDPGEGPSGLASQMLSILPEEEPREEPGQQRQRLPAFTQAFQTAQSPKPPPPPPPPH
ncbi:zinc finger protein 628-like [Cydia fagiglandana]|uniref:zinc finger protein 628-like n=1 Tax=Cydia fagiglandana TaxID=1458189 RepID=UPI002FEE310F